MTVNFKLLQYKWKEKKRILIQRNIAIQSSTFFALTTKSMIAFKIAWIIYRLLTFLCNYHVFEQYRGFSVGIRVVLRTLLSIYIYDRAFCDSSFHSFNFNKFIFAYMSSIRFICDGEKYLLTYLLISYKRMK